jgi:hypothetical protein
VRYFSVTSLGRRADHTALPLLEKLAAGDEIPHVRRAAIEALESRRETSTERV